MSKLLFSINSYDRYRDNEILTRLLRHYYPDSIIQCVTTNDRDKADRFNTFETNWFDVAKNTGQHDGVATSLNTLMKYDLEQFDWIWSLHCDALPSDMSVFTAIQEECEKNKKDVAISTTGNPKNGCMNDKNYYGYAAGAFMMRPSVWRKILPLPENLNGLWIEVVLAKAIGMDIFDFGSGQNVRNIQNILDKFNIDIRHDFDRKMRDMSEEMKMVVEDLI